MNTEPSLGERCRRAGIATSFHDGFGNYHEVSEATLRALLAAMPSAAAPGPHPVLPPVVILTSGADSIVRMSLPDDAHGQFRWQLTREDGERFTGRAPVANLGDVGLALPELPYGYHHLQVDWSGSTAERAAETTVIVAPARCYRPAALEGSGRRWGLSLQLYALRSSRNWGMGDFTDLIAVVRAAGRLGAACIGLNPLHALFPHDPEAASPYSPNSRVFLNTLYIDVEAVPEFQGHAVAHRLMEAPDFRDRLAGLRAAERVDYTGVAACKEPLLRLLYARFRDDVLHDAAHPRAKDFHAFQAKGGDLLRRFADFLAADKGEDEILYHEYLQWQAEAQLAKAQDVAKRLGLSIGLYQDLAVGISSQGADAAAYGDALLNHIGIGAPPDSWNMKGQDWGLVPFDPTRLRALAYRPLREMLSAAMQRGGALRIDHILGFLRLYLIPNGMSAADGAYLAYPWKDLLAILALESHRHQCLIIGEDLGTVPPGLREDLEVAGILSMRVFYFEKHDEHTFRPPEWYPTESMITVGTHDLPTLAAYWSGADIALRTDLNLWPTPQHCDNEHHARPIAHRAAAAFAGVDETSSDPPVVQLYGKLAHAPSRLLMVQIEDLMGQVAQMNVPGTWNEYPNWRVRYAQSIEELFANPTAIAVAETLAERSDLPLALGAKPATGDGPAIPAVPCATYRVQFSSAFTFDDAVRIVPYLAALGISHLYASPWLKARAGSTHGYDVVDHTVINPELGGAEGFENLNVVLKSYGIGHILDFVPNHMGINHGSNDLWRSVLECGRAAPAASFFDIAWRVGVSQLKDKVLLPVLGEHYGAALEQGKFRLHFDAARGCFTLRYYEHAFPIAPADYPQLLRIGAGDVELDSIAAKFSDESRPAQTAALQSDLAMLAHHRPEIRAALAAHCARMSRATDEPQHLDALHNLIERQPYHLAHWAAAADEINYRRFFNINDLAAVRMENPVLFAHAHSLVMRLIAEKKLHGLRIDHVDGLYDPEAYCTSLRAAVTHNAPAGFHIVVEKILAAHEKLRTTWPVQGTTGYEFIAQLNGVLVNAQQAAVMDRIYHRFIDDVPEFDSIVAEAKAQVLDTMFRAELRVLMLRLHRLAQRHWRSSDYTRESLRTALRAIVMHFPVYRTYVGETITPEDRRDIAWAVARARKAWRAPGSEVLEFVQDAITGDLARKDGAYPSKAVTRFVRQFQQFTAPIMAKSLEDTAFYRYHRLIALNEVGGDPRHFGLSLQAFHAQNRERERAWPASMLSTSTHDTKRGEDARARLLALPEMAARWGHLVLGWARLNARHKTEIDGVMLPDRNDEYLFYQALLGAWPADMGGAVPPTQINAFAMRMRDFMIKAVREAKQKSSWDNPNAEYETALTTFVERTLDPVFGRAFIARFLVFARQIAHLGLWNSLAQTVLKLTLPGVPDFYQGAELWDLSLVDPDNRRPVDYAKRMAMLADLKTNDVSIPEMQTTWQDGGIKLAVIHKLLALRQAQPDLFAFGAYEPLLATGDDADRIIAFQRRQQDKAVVVCVARHLQNPSIPYHAAWANTVLRLPQGRWVDVLTGERLAAAQDEDLDVTRLLRSLPAAVLALHDA
jgi:(1->4)-alpha-D-glucan 1-alpha-D-glucosylmutase